MLSSVKAATAAALVGTLVALPAAAQRGQQTRETVYDERFDLSGGGQLVVEVGDMDVRVEPGSSARVQVIAWAEDRAFARDIFEEMRFSAASSGGALRVETDEPRNYSYDWRERQARGGAWFEAIITVPSNTSLDLHTGDGDIVVGSFTGAAMVNTGDGDVSIESLEGPDISLRTGDGDVTAERLTASTITLRTGDGDLIVREASGAIDATTGDGDVSIDVGRFAGLSISTGDGDVTVFAEPSIRADLDVRGEDLSLSRDFTVSGSVEDRRIRGTLNGGGAELRIRTGDGDVSIRGR